ncbi:MAG: hypothetical protein ABEL76_02865 [Bradymonadaceae bacterium]
MLGLLDVLILAVLLALVTVAWNSKEGWSSFAEEDEDMRFTGSTLGGNVLSGERRGHPVLVQTESRHEGNHRMNYTVYEVDLQYSVPIHLTLKPESLGDEVGKAFGTEDIQVGDPAFDETFIVQSHNPEEARRFLQRDGIREAFLDLHEAHPGFTLERGRLEVDYEGTADSEETLQEYLEPLLDAADRLEAAGGSETWGRSVAEDDGIADEKGDGAAEW